MGAIQSTFNVLPHLSLTMTYKDDIVFLWYKKDIYPDRLLLDSISLLPRWTKTIPLLGTKPTSWSYGQGCSQGPGFRRPLLNQQSTVVSWNSLQWEHTLHFHFEPCLELMQLEGDDLGVCLFLWHPGKKLIHPPILVTGWGVTSSQLLPSIEAISQEKFSMNRTPSALNPWS